MKPNEIRKLIEQRNKQIIQEHNNCPACGESLKFNYSIDKKLNLVQESPVCESCRSKYGMQTHELH